VCNAEQQTRYLVDDLLSYLRYDAAGQRIIEDADIAAVRVTPHLDAPLFLNTTNAWDYRPDGRTCLKNVFVAGDYCRSPADLTTMESAIGAARQTAALVLNESGIQSHAAGAEQFDVPSPWLLRAAKWGCLPVILPIGAAYAISRRGRPDEE